MLQPNHHSTLHHAVYVLVVYEECAGVTVAVTAGVTILDEAAAVPLGVTAAVHAPVIEGTASTPDLIGTTFVPQFAELARWRFRLS